MTRDVIRELENTGQIVHTGNGWELVHKPGTLKPDAPRPEVQRVTINTTPAGLNKMLFGKWKDEEVVDGYVVVTMPKKRGAK